MNNNGKLTDKVLITGITGMDGSHMADYLLENTDYNIYGMVRRQSNPNFINIKHILNNPRINIIYGDLSDSNSVDKVVSKVKPCYFINFAAQSFVGSSWDMPEMTMDVNSTGVMRCLESIVRYVPDCRFYNAGSSEEFGDVSYSPQNESHPYRPRSPYGASKVSARQVVKTYRDSYGLYAVQGILYNHESPRRGEEFVTRKITKGVARIYKDIKDKNWDFAPIELGNLDAKRDWSHAKDFIRGVWMMLNQEKYNTELNDIPYSNIGSIFLPFSNCQLLSSHIKEYILSSDENHSIKEFVELAFGFADIKGVWRGSGITQEFLLSEDGFLSTKRYVPLVRVNPKFYRPAEVDLLLGDSSKARKELGWKPKYNFNQLIEEMVSNDIKHINSE